jgi:type IV pilus assembly protein PilM
MEIRAEGVAAARADDAAALLTAVSRADVPEGAVAPGLKPGNIVDKPALVAAARKALDGLAERGGGRLRDVTVIVPDSAARVLFLDFDQLPSKMAEALPVVRFRLKKLLPFDADDAVVSYQTMASEKGLVKLLVVAMPKAVLEEYEGVALAAGYLPGAVLPSTLAALGGIEETDSASLLVNASMGSVTTAIVQAGILLLHRSVDLTVGRESAMLASEILLPLPLVDREDTAGEWARQEALGPDGWDQSSAETAIDAVSIATAHEVRIRAAAREVAQAVSVAAAYYEDTLQAAPANLLVAGTLGAAALAAMMEESGLESLRIRELVDSGMMEAASVASSVPCGWLAGVRGALRN